MTATKWLNWIAVCLCFVVGVFLFYHNLTTINEDIGRHIKLGEIISQTKSVPHINLLSYTAANFPFINHHWLSEVVFYGLYRLGGFGDVMVAKIIVLVATYLILFWIVKNKLNIITILSFLMSLALISMRTDPRPEIFSYLIFAVFLLVIYRVRENRASINLLWLLPPLELLWVNLHIYFILGFAVYGAFLIERWTLKKLGKREIILGIILALVTLVNPNGLHGALSPLTIFSNYGVPIAENQPMLAIVKYYHAWLFPYNIFLISAAAMILGFVRQIPKIKYYLFELILFVFLVVSSLKMVRNIGTYAIFSLPAMAVLFWDLKIIQKFPTFNKIILGGLMVFMTFFLNSIRTNAFYENIGWPSRFGLFVPQFMQQAMDFFRNNNLLGPIFNDLGTGSYIEWKLYPEQKAFSDDRPEAYPASFWHDIYFPMQNEHEFWRQKSAEFGIRSVIFSHTAPSPSEQKFILDMLKDPDWPLVFVNDGVVIFVKRSNETRQLITAYGINSQNIESRIKDVTNTFDPAYDPSYQGLGDFLYRIGQYKVSLIPYQKLIDVKPDNPYGYERHALALAAENNGENTDQALAELQKAMSLGANDANDYLVLAVLLVNKNNLTDARTAIKKAYSLNPDDLQIKSLYSQLTK